MYHTISRWVRFANIYWYFDPFVFYRRINTTTRLYNTLSVIIGWCNVMCTYISIFQFCKIIHEDTWKIIIHLRIWFISIHLVQTLIECTKSSWVSYKTMRMRNYTYKQYLGSTTSSMCDNSLGLLMIHVPTYTWTFFSTTGIRSSSYLWFTCQNSRI